MFDQKVYLLKFFLIDISTVAFDGVFAGVPNLIFDSCFISSFFRGILHIIPLNNNSSFFGVCNSIADTAALKILLGLNLVKLLNCSIICCYLLASLFIISVITVI
jgi:hypothetical protein